MNDGFLMMLLKLQQDGSEAISAPSNWNRLPLLEVKTDLNKVIDDLKQSILHNVEGERTARWHFFIGSPGNGKSASVGKLVRSLWEKGYVIHTEEGLDAKNLKEKQIPYILEVKELDKKFSFAWLAQDASVLKNPFAIDVSPPKQLIDLLIEASNRGISLVVCTNRGVIENAYKLIYLDSKLNKYSWFKALKCAIEDESSVELEFDGEKKKKVFERFHVTSSHLDNYSLLINNNTFEELIRKATQEQFWDACKRCKFNEYCPFYLNKESLCQDEGRLVILKILRRAEMISGQIISFREALAVISFLLAGCPRDYYDKTTCEWVQSKIKKNDFFSLLSRRLYMSLFSSYSPAGFEYDMLLSGQQQKYLKQLSQGVTEENDATKALKCVLDKKNQNSTDVGVTRLFSASGVLRKLDPLSFPLPRLILENWSGDLDRIIKHDSSLVSPLEKKCCILWKFLEDQIEQISEEAVERYRWLQRWISSFTIRMGSMIEHHTAFGYELDEILEIMGLKNKEDLSDTDRKTLMSLEEQLRVLLNPLAEEGINISDNVSLRGDWTRDHLRPRIETNPKSKNLALIIRFGEQRQEVPISAETFVWLKRKADYHMSSKSFPAELIEAARDEQVRAASRSKYAYQDDEITLVINRPNGTIIQLKRYMGGVILNES